MDFYAELSPDGRVASFLGVRDGAPAPEHASPGWAWVLRSTLTNEQLSIGNRILPEPEEPDVKPTDFPAGIELPSITWPAAPDSGNDWESHVVDGVLVTDQVSASPRKPKAEREQIKSARRARVKAAQAELPELLRSGKLPDLRTAVERIAELLNLI